MEAEDYGDLEDDPDRFKTARDGDFLMCPFQCDACQLFNLKRRYPTTEDHRDELLQICIRRATLDAFWSREPSTVAKSCWEMRGMLEAAETIGLDNPLPPRGPFPIEDSWGVGTACMMLMKTMRPGRNSENIQFETARMLVPSYQTSSTQSQEGWVRRRWERIAVVSSSQAVLPAVDGSSGSSLHATNGWEMCGFQIVH
uniref:Uncharacterized protein n=1 Tax=Grammatophora oceanica TaxID=210454 RepID=A0A7S1V8W6_9STRA|mmetsp:Transcript_39832/g.59082  ORF Transcript_39832/g.59082 Transcript_39832/m.59082 type:complete len:199 (+) Transcript_39832:1567-2163(+)